MTAIAAMALAALQAPAAQPGEGGPLHPVAELFMSACFDGSIRVPTEDLRDVERSELPAAIRRGFNFRGGERWRFVEIRRPHFAYLLIKSEGGRRDYFRTICAVAATDFDLRQVYGQVRRAMVGEDASDLPSGDPRQYKFANYGQGYEVSASERPGEWLILRVGHIGEGGRRHFEAEGRWARQRFGAGPSRRPDPGDEK